MSVMGITMVKDEVDIVGRVIRNMLLQVDSVMVADNGSTDGTLEVLQALAVESSGRVTVTHDPEIGYYQSRKVTALAAAAHAAGATWVVPFDADEIWYSPHGRIADVLTACAAAVVRADLYDHVATAVDPAGSDPVASMGWRRRAPARLHKVACRAVLPVVIEQGNHGAHFDGYPGEPPQLLVVRHFPYRSVAQLVKKVRNGSAAYKATTLPEDHGKHWRDYGRLLEAGGEAAIGDLFRRWFWYADPAGVPDLIFDPVCV